MNPGCGQPAVAPILLASPAAFWNVRQGCLQLPGRGTGEKRAGQASSSGSGWSRLVSAHLREKTGWSCPPLLRAVLV